MSCQQRSLALETEIWGTATESTTQWILVEYCGEWHPKMRIPNLQLPVSFAEALDPIGKRYGWKILWIRRPGASGKYVYWWDLDTKKCKVASIDADWTNGFDNDILWQYPQDIGLSAPQVLVCTHGQRDRCCAVLGGVIFAELRRHLPETVWQVTHLGGHRFAPTALCLPLGLLLGRIEQSDGINIARAVMMQNPRLIRTAIIRGDVRLSKREQARQLWLIEREGELLSTTDERFVWLDKNGQNIQTRQYLQQLGELAVSCGDVETKPVYQWCFESHETVE